jgi:hypothetical protein
MKMHEDSFEMCESLVTACIVDLKAAMKRLIAHEKLKNDLMDSTSTVGKALRKIGWMNESEDNMELNAYESDKGPWRTVVNAMEKAGFDDNEIISHITLIPGKLELFFDMEELFLTFSSEEDYFRLIVELHLNVYEEE